MQLSHILLLTGSVVLLVLASVQSGKSGPVPKSSAELTTVVTATGEAAADLEIEQLANLPMTNARSARNWSSWFPAHTTGTGTNSMRRGKLLNLHKR